MKTIIIDNYGKGSAIIGETFPIKDKIKEIGGSFNSRLKYEGLTVAGWVFSKKKLDAIRDLVLSHHAQPVSVATPEPVIIERDEKLKVEPIKQVKQMGKVKQTGFKMLVKCSGFIELEREFTSEQVMVKFLNDLRKQRETEVDSKMGICKKGMSRIEYFSNYGTSEDRQSKYDKAVLKLKQDFEKANVLPLKIEFTNLNNK